MPSIQNKIISFFIRHPEEFKQVISYEYSFSYNQLLKYKSEIYWNYIIYNFAIEWGSQILNLFKNPDDWQDLSVNSGVFKDIRLIDEFYDKIIWKSDGNSKQTIAENFGLPWSLEFIKRYENSWDFKSMSKNKKVPWTEELIDKYIGEWDWKDMSENEKLPWSSGFIKKYKQYIDTNQIFFKINPILTGDLKIVEQFGHLLSWEGICRNPDLPWFEQNLIMRWHDKINWFDIAGNDKLVGNTQFFEAHLDKWLEDLQRFKMLSWSHTLPWSISFIDRFKSNWDWGALSVNPSLPWSSELIDYYADYWNCVKIQWDKVYFDEYGKELIVPKLEKYKSFNQGLESNIGVPWSIDLILRYENMFEIELLLKNPYVWDEAFKPYVDDKVIDIVFRLIN